MTQPTSAPDFNQPCFLHLLVHTPQGLFSGDVNATAIPLRDALSLRDKLQASGLNLLTLYPAENRNPDALARDELTFFGDLLAKSVLQFTVEPATR